LEPAQPYLHGWHIDAMSEHLEAVTNGEIQDLIINIPPRHMKSLEVVVFWPSWEWIKKPHLRYLNCAYGESLSKRDNVKKRRLIQSRWYQDRWGDVFQLVGDQNEKLRFENDKTGYSIATSTEGMGTGEGGDRILVDDPHNTKEALSDQKRTNVITWWDETMQSRLNNILTV